MATTKTTFTPAPAHMLTMAEVLEKIGSANMPEVMALLERFNSLEAKNVSQGDWFLVEALNNRLQELLGSTEESWYGPRIGDRGQYIHQ